MSSNTQPLETPLLSSRPYESEADLRQMLAMLMEARQLTQDWRYAHVGELLWNFFMVDRHLDPCRHIRLWHAGGKLVAYAMLGEDPAFDWQVLPLYEWTGIEEQALRWAEDLRDRLRRKDEKRWGGAMVSGARLDNPQRIAFLEQHGFRGGGPFSEVNLLRSLEGDLAVGSVPAGWQVRAVEESEIAARAAVHGEVWQPWTVGDVTAQDYACFMRLPGYERQLDVVAVNSEGVIAAYVNGWNDPLNRIGDLGPLGALPAYRRQGLTRAVLLECMRRMQAGGMERVCVSTGVSNEAARRLYESIGFEVVNEYGEYVKEK